jgi:hypothetical protein
MERIGKMPERMKVEDIQMELDALNRIIKEIILSFTNADEYLSEGVDSEVELTLTSSEYIKGLSDNITARINHLNQLISSIN